MHHQHSLTNEGVIRLFGAITLDSITPVIEAIIAHNLRQDRPFLRLWIDSPGGDLHQGFALLDIMRWSALPIHTTGFGLVGSMALLVLMAGPPGARTVLPRTSLLSHRFHCSTSGNHADMLAERSQQDLIHQRILAHYADCCHRPAAEVERELLLPTNRWLCPDEAVNTGIIDRIWTQQEAS